MGGSVDMPLFLVDVNEEVAWLDDLFGEVCTWGV